MTINLHHLSLHVGLPKTGSTTLQKCFVASLPNYAGRGGVNYQTGLFKEIREVFSREKPNIWRNDATRSLRESLYKSAVRASQNSERGTAVFSFENFLSTDFILKTSPRKYQRAYDWSLAHLEELLRAVFPTVENTAVLLTIRRQPEWLASLYSQWSNRIRSASQDHFLSVIRRSIAAGEASSPLNYYALSTRLESILAPSSLTILPLEQINDPIYWERINSWLRDGFVIEATRRGLHLNKRSVDSAGWELRPYHRPVQSKISRFVRTHSTGTFGAAYARRRGIWLPEPVRNEILEFVAESNSKLSRKAELPLQEYLSS